MEENKYGSIVAFAVSENAGESAWGALVKDVVAIVASLASATNLVEQVDGVLKSKENEYKADFNKTAVPKAYRSAKCVALKALECGVSLLDGSGEPRGKTLVEKLCKTDPVVTKDILDYWNQFLDRLNQCTDEDKLSVVKEEMNKYLIPF